jgi:hypothetical protein
MTARRARFARPTSASGPITTNACLSHADPARPVADRKTNVRQHATNARHARKGSAKRRRPATLASTATRKQVIASPFVAPANSALRQMEATNASPSPAARARCACRAPAPSPVARAKSATEPRASPCAKASRPASEASASSATRRLFRRHQSRSCVRTALNTDSNSTHSGIHSDAPINSRSSSGGTAREREEARPPTAAEEANHQVPVATKRTITPPRSMSLCADILCRLRWEAGSLPPVSDFTRSTNGATPAWTEFPY